MTVFVTGVNGQLGHDVMNELHRRGYTGIGSDRTVSCGGIADGSEVAEMPYVQLDITDGDMVEHVLTETHPDAVIHCAAWTDVDQAEGEAELVRTVNVEGTRHIAEACRKTGSKMVYLSTDYVFDGRGTRPWDPDCREFHPLNVYGRTKLEGEQAVNDTLNQYFIVRTSGLFGAGSNFVKTMLELGRTRHTVKVVKDQIGRPTYSYDLAHLLVDMIETDKYGYYHATNEGRYISWYDFACEIFRRAGEEVSVVPVTTEEYGLNKATRPYNSRLDTDKLVENGFEPLPVWQDALSRYLNGITY